LVGLLVPVFTTQYGSPGAAGLLFAVWGVSRVVGGLWFGARTIESRDLPSGYVRALGLLVLGLCGPVAAVGLWWMALALLVGGVLIGPATVLQYLLIQTLAHARYRAESFAWVLSASVGGATFGSLITGEVVGHRDAHAAFATVVALGGVGVVIAGFSVRRWRRFVSPSVGIA